MARLTESQRRRIREQNMERRLDGKPQMTDREAASFIGVSYNPSTWAADYGGWDSYTGGSHSSPPCDSSPTHSSPSDGGGGFSCGGGGGCD